MNFIEKAKKFDIRHILCVAFIIIAWWWVFQINPNYAVRLVDSLKSLCNSVVYYFSEIFGVGSTPPFVIEPTMPSAPPTVVLPSTFEEFKIGWQNYWSLFCSSSNFMSYFEWVAKILFLATQILLPLILLFVILKSVIKARYNKVNNNYDKDSKILKCAKVISRYTYVPLKNGVKGLVDFLKNNRYYLYSLLTVFLLGFNVLSVIIGFLAFYFKFILTFDLVSFYSYIYSVCLDLTPLFKSFPFVIWLIVGFLLFDRMRKRIALIILRSHERYNKEFIEDRPIVFMLCGTMGKFKTTTLTDIVLSEQVRLRDTALRKLFENDMKFPYFPFINLENELKILMDYRVVYNLASIKQWVRKKKKRFEKEPCKMRIFDYDYERYGVVYDNCLQQVNIWTVLENYAQLYFIYLVNSAVLSNYAIRLDSVVLDNGNFPLFDNDFFTKKSTETANNSVYSHILDFDSLRLGRKVLEENSRANSFEFGVVCITEIGKERKNTLELNGKKKDEERANQKNDLFNSWLKMVRHSATVDNFPFVSVVTDEQRPESWGADARDLCEIVHIRKADSITLAMPFFGICDVLCRSVLDSFNRFYYDYRYKRGDNTLFMHLLKGLVSKLNRYYTRIYNRFGYRRLKVEVERGTQDGAVEKHNYYLANIKIYSQRFSTDCFNDFFTQKALRSSVGINDMPSYESECATINELSEQHSYFVEEWFTCMGNCGERTNE